MRVAEHDDIGSVARQQSFGCRTADFMTVTHVDGATLQLEVEMRVEVRRAGRVGVAVDGMHRRNGTKLVKDVLAADVTGVEDDVDARECREDLRPKEAMGIGHEADEHGLVYPRRAPRASRQPANLYPIPCTVRMNCGWRGLGSIFWRSHATCTSTVRVDGMEL